jgi:hypothetical protein
VEVHTGPDPVAGYTLVQIHSGDDQLSLPERSEQTIAARLMVVPVP